MSDMLLIPKGREGTLNAYFAFSEFACKCDDPKCRQTLIHTGLASKLAALREAVARPLTLNCAYRCPPHNKAVGGADHSIHVYGAAADVRLPQGITTDELADMAEKLGFQGIGKYDSFVHMDMRVTGPARWDLRGTG